MYEVLGVKPGPRQTQLMHTANINQERREKVTQKNYSPSSSPSAESCNEFGFPDNVYTRMEKNLIKISMQFVLSIEMPLSKQLVVLDRGLSQ